MKAVVTLLVPALLALVAAGGGGLRAQTPTTPTGPSGFGKNTDGALLDFLKLYDLDGNGALSIEEQQALRRDRQRSKRFRERWDTNRDGTISDAERDAARAQIRLTIEQQRRKRFAEVDTDNDGFLSPTEFATIPAVQTKETDSPGIASDLFAHIDINPTDGKISEAEFLSALDRPEPPPEPTNSSLDSSGGGGG